MTTFEKTLELAAKQRAETLARYLTVKHLPHDQAAKALGLSVDTVRNYRKRNKQAAPDQANIASVKPKEKAVRPGTIQHTIPICEPFRSSSATASRVTLITLPAPPWGGGFERQWVSA